jgi:imidazolonepropionase-like amidohydrolase
LREIGRGIGRGVQAGGARNENSPRRGHNHRSSNRRRGAAWQDLSFLDQPLIRDTTPPSFLEDLRAQKPSPSWERGAKQENEKRFRQQAANLKRLFDAGLLIAAGTDAPYPGVFQGEGIHHELELLVEAGLTPLQAITAAAANAARLVGAGDE